LIFFYFLSLPTRPNVHVGKAVHVGSNATIREKTRIGDFSLIGSGAVVLHDVPDNCVTADDKM